MGFGFKPLGNHQLPNTLKEKLTQTKRILRKKNRVVSPPGNLHVDNNQNKYFFFAQVIGTALPLVGSW